MFVEGYATASRAAPVSVDALGAHALDPAPPSLHAALLATAAWPDDADHAFDIHVFACLLAVALEESTREQTPVSSTLGLSGAAISDLLGTWFPGFDRAPLSLDGAAPEIEMEEEILRDLLTGHVERSGEGMAIGLRETLADILPTVIAHRAMRPDHLWQDLGLFDRGDLNRLLARHFPTLHAGNTANMRWKKYFYRKLCEAEGFALCIAPSCSVCADFASCFGEEDGESRMAAARRAMEGGGTIA